MYKSTSNASYTFKIIFVTYKHFFYKKRKIYKSTSNASYTFEIISIISIIFNYFCYIFIKLVI